MTAQLNSPFKGTSTQSVPFIEDIVRKLPSGTQTPAFSTKVPIVPDQSLSQSIIETWQSQQYLLQIRSTISTSSIFHHCLQEWKEETKFTSSLIEILMHPSYQRIIGLGPNVIPFILRELYDNGGLWFWALQSLTGENPVPEQDQGRPGKMAEAWLQWGYQKQLI